MSDDFSQDPLERLQPPVFWEDQKPLRAVRSLVGFYCEESFEDRPSYPIVGYFGFANPELEDLAKIFAGTLFISPGIVWGESPIRRGKYSRIDDEELIRIEASPIHYRDLKGKLVDAIFTFDLKRENKTDFWNGTWNLDKSTIPDREPPKGLIRCKIEDFKF